MSLTDRHPSIRVAGLAFSAGVALAIAIAGFVSLSMWAADAPWDQVVDTGTKLAALLLFVCPWAFAGASLLVYQRKVMIAVSPIALPQSEVREIGAGEWEARPETSLNALARQVKWSILYQLAWKYRDGQDPTRDLMCQEVDLMTQPLWNSGRRAIIKMGVVENKQWQEMAWAEVQALMDRIVVDGEQIWVPMNGGRGLKCMSVVTQGEGNSYVKEETPLP